MNVLRSIFSKGLSGKEASSLLGEVNVTVNKNLIPFDPKPPAVASGIRIGTTAVTTRGMKQEQMSLISGYIDEVLTHRGDSETFEKIKRQVLALTERFPLYQEIK